MAALLGSPLVFIMILLVVTWAIGKTVGIDKGGVFETLVKGCFGQYYFHVTNSIWQGSGYFIFMFEASWGVSLLIFGGWVLALLAGNTLRVPSKGSESFSFFIACFTATLSVPTQKIFQSLLFTSLQSAYLRSPPRLNKPSRCRRQRDSWSGYKEN